MNFFNQSETTNPNWPKIIIMANFVRGYVTVKTLSNLDGKGKPPNQMRKNIKVS